MQEVMTRIFDFITPGAVKAALALVALIGMLVSLPRKSKGGIVTLLIALAGWLSLDVLSAAVSAFPRALVWQCAVWLAVMGMVLCMRWWRWAGWVSAALWLTIALGQGLLYLPALLRSLWMIGTARSLAEAVYALLSVCAFGVAVAYSVCLAVWRRPEPPQPEEKPVSAPLSPLPADVTLAQILPEAETAPTKESKPAPVPREPAVLPETVLQTGIGAEILRCKRQLDAGEITPEEFARRKAALMGQTV